MDKYRFGATSSSGSMWERGKSFSNIVKMWLYLARANGFAKLTLQKRSITIDIKVYNLPKTISTL